MTQPSDQPEFPRVEPEIIPPDRSRTDRFRTDPYRPWQPSWGGASDFRPLHGTQRVYATRIGPVGIVIALLAVAGLSAAILLTLIGAVLLWLPVVALIIAAAFVARVFRRRMF